MDWEKPLTKILVVTSVLFITFLYFQVYSHEHEPGLDPWTRDKGFVADHSLLPYHGIDVSEKQGYIDWQAISMDQKVEFVYIKATDGPTHVDKRYASNVYAANNFGCLTGSFHRLTTEGSMVQQFFNFNKHVVLSAQKLVPMVELDEYSMKGWSREQIQDSLNLFVWLVNEYYGCEPIIRTSQEFFETQLHPQFDDAPLFILHERQKEPKVTGARRVWLYQRNEHGYIPGIFFDVNQDAFTAGTDIEQLII